MSNINEMQALNMSLEESEMKIEPQNVISINSLPAPQISEIDRKVTDLYQQNSILTKEIEEKSQKIRELEKLLHKIREEAFIEQKNLARDNEKLQQFIGQEKLGKIRLMSDVLGKEIKDYEHKIKQLEIERNKLKSESAASEYLNFVEKYTFSN